MSVENETASNRRLDLTVLGKIIGTYTGWDVVDENHDQFYNFQPNNLGKTFLRNSKIFQLYDYITIDYTNGKVAVEASVQMMPDPRDVENYTTEVIPDWSVFNTDYVEIEYVGK